MVCSLEAGLKAYADSVRRHAKQLHENAVIDPRSAYEQSIAAEMSIIADNCHKPRPVDGTHVVSYSRNRKI